MGGVANPSLVHYWLEMRWISRGIGSFATESLGVARYSLILIQGRHCRCEMGSWASLNRQIIECQRCPRLIRHCARVAREKRRAYQEWEYWGRPVPNFGSLPARLLIVGLAPAAHGANRTGRMFTGDRSGDWLYRALYKAGFATQSASTDSADGMHLVDCVITAVCHCAPPDNKPTAGELTACRSWLDETIDQTQPHVYLALGHLAWKSFVDVALDRGWWTARRPKFGHAVEVQLDQGAYLVGSYHPSQQNTFTGRLTEPMFDQVFDLVHRCLKAAKHV